MPYDFPKSPVVNVSDVFFRTVAGVFGGGFGSLVLLIGVLLSGTFASSYIAAVEVGVHPFIVFIALVISYVAILVSSLASLTFFYYTDKERYPFLLSTLSHVFWLITIVFLVSTPLSLLLSLQSFESLSIIALILMGVCTIFSVLAMEIVSDSRHLLLVLYSSAVAIFAFFLVMLILYLIFNTTSYLLPMALPFCWGSFGFWQGTFEKTYQWLYELYGKDFLNADERVGSDYVKEQRMKR
ncbi:MAG: hypothetical protein P1V18_04560 [Candidatus Gracilibacteria bacterium]|nr:hypothetical protein [Candidatus Gracilibacteria bacterium]